MYGIDTSAVSPYQYAGGVGHYDSYIYIFQYYHDDDVEQGYRYVPVPYHTGTTYSTGSVRCGENDMLWRHIGRGKTMRAHIYVEIQVVDVRTLRSHLHTCKLYVRTGVRRRAVLFFSQGDGGRQS